MVRTRSILRALVMVVVSGALALPAVAQSNASMPDQSSASNLNSGIQSTSQVSDANVVQSNAPVSAASDVANPAPISSANDNSMAWTIGLIALAVVVLGGIVWAANRSSYEPRSMTRV